MGDSGDQDSDEAGSGSAAVAGRSLLVRVLGPCTAEEVEGDALAGTPVALSRVQRTMLARLALARPGSVEMGALIEAVWGTAPPATARTSIHNQISRIRGRLGSDAIATRGEQYFLSARTDVEVAANGLIDAEQLVMERSFHYAVSRTEETLSLWRGDAFDELGELDEARAEALRLSEARRSLETLRLEALIGVGRLAAGVPEAERLVAQTPDDEHRWVLLIRALELAGRRGDALGAYERARRWLAQELGIAPGPELRDAELTLLENPTDQRAVGPAPFVGRSDLLQRAMDRCDSGAPVVLVGEAGIGKSRTLDELWRRLRRGTGDVVTSTCPQHPDTAVSILRDLASDLGVLLDPNLPLVGAFTAAMTARRESGGRVVLIVDDLDRAGPTSIAALQAASALDGVTLVAAVGDPAMVPDELSVDALVVEPLREGELAELADLLVNDRHDMLDLEPEWLFEMSGGNPSILEQMLDDPRALERADVEGHPNGGSTVPAVALRNGLRRRVEQLAATTRAALEVTAVCGPSPVDLLSELTPAHGISGAVAAGLLGESTTDGGDVVISFRHGIARNVLYDDIPPGRRMEIHYRVASLLRSAGAPAANVAIHSLAAAEVDPRSAVDDALRAAADVSGDGAHADAAQWYELALEAIERTDADEALRVATLVGLGDSLRLAGRADQEAVLFRAADAAFALGDHQLIGDAAFAVLQLGFTTESGQFHERAIELADRALDAVDTPDQRARVAAAASLTHSMGGDAPRCRRLFVEAERAATSSATRREVLPFAYLATGHPRDLGLRTRLTDELVELGRASGDPVALFEGMHLAFSVGLQRCDGESARAAAEASTQLIEQVGDVGRRWALAYQHAAVAHLDGDLELAERHSQEALEMFVAVSPSRAMAAYGGQLLMIRWAQGRLGELVATLEDLVASQPGVPAWHAALALALVEGDPDRALLHTRSALDDMPEDFIWLAAHLVGGRAAALVGDEATQRSYIGRLEPHSGLGSWQGTCSYGPVDLVLASLHRAVGEADSASAYRRRARSQAEALGAPVFLAELDRADG